MALKEYFSRMIDALQLGNDCLGLRSTDLISFSAPERKPCHSKLHLPSLASLSLGQKVPDRSPE